MNTIHQTTCNQINHIISFLGKIQSICALKLNSCGWMFEDDTDPNYSYFEIHHNCEKYIHQFAWIMTRLPREMKTGDPLQEKLYDKMICLHRYIYARETSSYLSKFSTPQVYFDELLSKPEIQLFLKWLRTRANELYNYTQNPSKSQDLDIQNRLIIEQIIKKLEHEIGWILKSKPKNIPTDVALHMWAEYRYREIQSETDKKQLIQYITDIYKAYCNDPSHGYRHSDNIFSSDLNFTNYMAKHIYKFENSFITK